MFAIHKKKWTNIKSELHAHLIRSWHVDSLQGQRFWAVIGSVFVLALVIAAISALAMLAAWILKIDLSAFDLRPMIN